MKHEITYADGSTEVIESDQSADTLFDQLFAPHSKEVQEKCSVVTLEAPAPKVAKIPPKSK